MEIRLWRNIIHGEAEIAALKSGGESPPNRMKKLKNILRGALVAGLLSASMLPAAIITEITLGDFTAPNILDFESAAVDLSVANNDPLFTAIGISSITGTADDYADDFQDRANSSERALWFTSGGQLAIVDPSDTNGIAFGQDNTSYEIEFTNAIFRFGFHTHDEPFAEHPTANPAPPPLTITFFFGLTQIGQTTSSGVLVPGAGPSPEWDRRQFYFGSDGLFNRVVLSTAGSNQGFGLDDFAVDPEPLSDVPEPGSLALFGLGLMGAAFIRRKRQNR